MKKLVLIISIFMLQGCSTIDVPNYLHDRNPYAKTFYKDFEITLQAAEAAIKDLGWVIEKKVDPVIFEQDHESSKSVTDKVLLFTDVRQTSLFVGTRYARMNIYFYSTGSNTTQAEFRYLTVTSLFFKEFYSYKNNAAIDRIIRRIEEELE